MEMCSLNQRLLLIIACTLPNYNLYMGNVVSRIHVFSIAQKSLCHGFESHSWMIFFFLMVYLELHNPEYQVQSVQFVHKQCSFEYD